MITKPEALRRVAGLVEQLKQINSSILPYKLSEEIESCEREIKLLEDDLSLMIDTHMAHKYRIYNSKKSIEKLNESKESGKLLGIWNRLNYDKMVS